MKIKPNPSPMRTPLIMSALVIALAFSACKKDKANQESEQLPVVSGSPFLNKVYEYKPAPGQFTNDGGISDLAKTELLVGAVGKGLVSLGGYGGYLVFGFDHALTNDKGPDIGIYGNPLTVLNMEFSEPGIVCVMRDDNKNGLPDDTWYELAGSEYKASGTVKNYKITYYRPAKITDDIRWTDNQGQEGLVLRNQFHAQDYYPGWSNANEISFSGTKLKSTLTAGSIITNKPLSYGYADNGSAEYADLQKELGRGYNTFDLDWAVDVAGNQIILKTIDFVKVYTGQNSNGNPFSPDNTNVRGRMVGEISTEFAGAVDLKLMKK